ncbi:MAG: hypothetical protein JOZ46_09445 [Candidatus Dormibacteraeota bacterium]|nr:hypothetical protein [Candidatus Dormibacteraeota bacterium]MBV9526019.1 hypothetical protein [Candidatus Dormibacteraeota bacterium]
MSIQDAIVEMDTAKERAARVKRQRRLRVAQVQRLEQLLEDVETRNLQRDRQVPTEMWRELVELDGLLPVRAPKRLWEARNTARLHDAILDWEGDLLDQLTPHRRDYTDTRDD